MMGMRRRRSDRPSKRLMELLAASIRLGTTNTKEIAAHLEWPVLRVRTYWERIMAWTGTNSRPEAQLRALARGWLVVEVEKAAAPAAEDERPAA